MIQQTGLGTFPGHNLYSAGADVPNADGKAGGRDSIRDIDSMEIESELLSNDVEELADWIDCDTTLLVDWRADPSTTTGCRDRR